MCVRACAFMCLCVFPGGDETLSLTRCCSVKVKPYRMSGMMTRTERFHLIPPFPFFPSVPPICLPHPRLRPSHSQEKTDIYRPSPRVCIKTLRGCVGLSVCVCCVCGNSVKPCFPTSKANSQMPEATVSVCMVGLVFTTHCQTSLLQSTMAALLLLLGCYNTVGLPVTIISRHFILLLHYISEGNIGLFSALYLSDFARFSHTKVR